MRSGPSGPRASNLQWRLIGHLQRNKVQEGSFGRLRRGFGGLTGTGRRSLEDRRGGSRILRVLIEVNTSGEASKHGVAPEEAENLLHGILENCPALRPEGFMTIGLWREERRKYGRPSPFSDHLRICAGQHGAGSSRAFHGYERRFRLGGAGRKHHGAHRVVHFRCAPVKDGGGGMLERLMALLGLVDPGGDYDDEDGEDDLRPDLEEREERVISGPLRERLTLFSSGVHPGPTGRRNSRRPSERVKCSWWTSGAWSGNPARACWTFSAGLPSRTGGRCSG